LANRVTRTAVIAVSAIGTSGLLAVSAQAAAPTIPTALVNQPAVTEATSVTPESAVLNGVVDTGGNPQSTFSLPANTTLTWAGSFNLIGGSTVTTEHVEGIPSNLSNVLYNTSSSSTVLQNEGADNYSTVLFEYDPLADYAANGNNPGPLTGFASEENVSTLPGLSSVSAEVGEYPNNPDSLSLSGPLTPGTKYVYFIVQQAGATDAAQTVNTFNPSSSTASTSTNPSYSCYPDSYIAAVSPYNGYTTTGTLSGGVSSAGTPNTTPQPEIQGPCVYYYGGGSNYYQSATGTFVTPSLGTVKFSNGVIKSTDKILNKVVGHKVVVTKVPGSKKLKRTTVAITKKFVELTNISANLTVENQSVEKTSGSVALTYSGKAVGAIKYTVAAQATKGVVINLTTYGKALIASGKTFTATVGYTTTTDQLQGTKTITL
jgi:hypothetical protein